MNRVSVVPAFLAMTLLLSTGNATGQERSDMDVLTDLRSRLEQAESTGNLVALAKLYADDIIYQTSETAPVVGLDAVLLLWRMFLDRATLNSTYSSTDQLVWGDEAEDRGITVQAYTMRDGGEETADTLHYTLRYTRTPSGAWQISSALYAEDLNADFRIPQLLPPTGPYRVGVLNLQAVDSTRSELLTEDPSDLRTVSAQVWYPARPDDSARPEKYRTREMTRAAASFLGWPILFNSFFELVDSHSFPASPPDGSDAPYPVILYHHGYGGFTRVHVALIEDLVSHGYVVASIGHAFESMFLETPSGGLILFDPDNPAYTARLEEAHGEEQERLKDRVVESGSIEEQGDAYRALLAASPRHQESTRTWSADGSFVLDRLAKLNTSEGLLDGLLDLARVGVIGHSLGGAAAGQAVTDDPRVIAGVDLDGFMFGDLIDADSDAPFMYVSAARPWAGVGGSALTVFFERSAGPSYLVVIDGFEHSTFTDLPLFLSVWPGEEAELDGERALGIQRAYVRAFFDRHMRDADATLLDGPSRDFPEVSIRSRNVP